MNSPKAEISGTDGKKRKKGWIWVIAAVLVIAAGLAGGMLLARMGTAAYQAKVQCDLASDAMEAGDPQQAAASYSNAVYLDPSCAEAYYSRGTAYLALLPDRDPGEANAYLALAKADFENAHALDPETYPESLPQAYLVAESSYARVITVEIQRFNLGDESLDYGASTDFSYDLVTVSGCACADAVNERIEAHFESFRNTYLGGARARIAGDYASGAVDTDTYVCRMEAGTPYRDDRYLSIPLVVVWQIDGEDLEYPSALNFDLRNGNEISLGTVLGMNQEDARKTVLTAALEIYDSSFSEESRETVMETDLGKLLFWFDSDTVWVYVQDGFDNPTVTLQNQMNLS